MVRTKAPAEGGSELPPQKGTQARRSKGGERFYRGSLRSGTGPPRFLSVMARSLITEDPPPTLPDLLRSGLDLVFVGINPGLYSARQGHYFARRTNRFWPALSRSILSAAARRALDVVTLVPEHDAALLDHRFGFTHVLKRPTRNAPH